MDTQQSEVKFYNLSDNKSIVSLKIPEDVITKWFEGKRRELKLYIILDISGSMAGSGLTQAKASILKLMEGLFESHVLSEKDITCFFFQSNCEVKRFSDDPNLLWSNGEIVRYFNGVNSYGGTNFTPVFESIIKEIKDIDSDLAIIFFTDGQGGYSDLVKSQLEIALAQTGFSTEIHTIGFTGDHDAKLLSWLTKLGTKQGNFQYVQSSGDIQSTMSTTLELLELGDRSLYVKMGDELLPTGFDVHGRGKLVLTGENANIEGRKLSIFKDKESEEKFDIETDPIQVHPDDPLATLLTVPYIQFEITRLTNEIINSKNEEGKRQRFNEISQEANDYDEKLNVILQNAFKSKSITRRELIQQCMDAKGTILQFKDILSEALKGTLTNQKIADFNNLAYKNITKQRLKKKLDNRAIKNVEKMEEVEKKIEEIVSKIDFDELENQESEDNLQTYTCTISTDNYVEAMKEGECMCLTLDVGRSEAAIADPSQISIKKINQTLMSSGAFLNSVTFALNDKFDVESVHGGFQKETFPASILKGLARENITGILPLYINEKHWSIAREKIKPIMGYLVTLDIFGYAYSQISTVPFLVLSRALGDTSSEFKRRQAKWILETCDAIYKQSSILREDNKKLFENYMKSPANRTIEHVPNNLVFLGHLFCALRCGDVSAQDVQRWLQEGLIKSLIEETIRRRLNKWQDLEESMEDIGKVLGINQKVYINEPVEEFEKSYAEYFKALTSDKNANIHYAAAFEKALSDSGIKVETVKEEPMDEDTKEVPELPTVKQIFYDSNTYQISDYALSIIAKIKKAVNTFVEIILRYNKILESTLANPNVSLDNSEFVFTEGQTSLADAFFDKYNSKTILATFLQSFLHRQNSVRREAVEADPPKYYEPFSEDTADELLSAQFDEYISSNLKRKTNDIMSTFAQEKSSALGLKFWQVDKVEEAAGLLLIDVKFRGSSVYGQILKALQKTSMPLVKEKIEMVISGTWQGITLFVDKPRNPDDPESLARFVDNEHWFPNRQKVYRMLNAHRSVIPEIDYWVRVLPPYKEYIEHQFDNEYLHARRLTRVEERKNAPIKRK
ncbi:hypothetical protein RclHR1_04480007 [Rhizophagus clarus]|uniref:VWFA domain-containing protein n=1 Tax=Rhizophagus clarus TaxID=94130 RepID=A0A2Z6RMK6_9GLOM|nr:hypothetical protein RclHR1_04480007 [Rhizophagus clarus]GES77866.1 hypothetical protein RCL_jg29380.t1 [Rhizophagus clarus]